jgi:hypothetical protein
MSANGVPGSARRATSDEVTIEYCTTIFDDLETRGRSKRHEVGSWDVYLEQTIVLSYGCIEHARERCQSYSNVQSSPAGPRSTLSYYTCTEGCVQAPWPLEPSGHSIVFANAHTSEWAGRRHDTSSSLCVMCMLHGAWG